MLYIFIILSAPLPNFPIVVVLQASAFSPASAVALMIQPLQGSLVESSGEMGLSVF